MSEPEQIAVEPQVDIVTVPAAPKRTAGGMRAIARAALQTGAGSVGSLLCGAIAIKTIALLLGPDGVGLFSLLRQTQQTAAVAGSFGGQTAVVQGIASREGEDRTRYINTCSMFFVGGAVLITAILLGGGAYLTRLLIGSDSAAAAPLLRWLVPAAIFGVAMAYFAGVLNAFHEIKTLAWMQFLGTFFLAAFAYPVAQYIRRGHPLAYVWFITFSAAAGALYGLAILLRRGYLKSFSAGIRTFLDRRAAKHFAAFAGTSFVINMLNTGAILVIRSMVAHVNGLKGAGMFDVAWTLSMLYVMVVLTSFSTYYLPTLSAVKEVGERRILMSQLFRFGTLAMVPLVTSVIVLKPLVIHLLYTGEFDPALQTMRWMLLGDYVKVAGWVLAVPLLAYADLRMYLWTELGFMGLLGGSAAVSLYAFHTAEGIGMAFFAGYVLYFAILIPYVKRRFGFALQWPLLSRWLIGAVLVGGASLYTWHDTHIRWPALLWIVAAGAFSLAQLRPNERQYMIRRLRTPFAS